MFFIAYDGLFQRRRPGIPLDQVNGSGAAVPLSRTALHVGLAIHALSPCGE